MNTSYRKSKWLALLAATALLATSIFIEVSASASSAAAPGCVICPGCGPDGGIASGGLCLACCVPP